jgi:hypothetical protein
MVSAVNGPAQALSGQPLNVTWTVRNNGAATALDWYDAVFLSFDPVFDRAADVYLGYVAHTGGLEPGARYSVTSAFTVPPNLEGTVWLFALTDSRNRVYERQAEANNIARSAPLTLGPPPMSDLVVTRIEPPAGTVMVGAPRTIAYTVLNQSAATVSGRWEDSVYLSADPVWDINDALLGKVTVSRDLGAWESYTGTLTAPIPAVVPGDYYVLVRADIRNYLPESDEANNLSVSTQTLPVDIVELTLGLPYSSQLFTDAEHFYKVHTPSNETLAVTLDSAAPEGANELFARFGAVPNRAEYDAGNSRLLATNQVVVIPDTQQGHYYILLHATDVLNPPMAYTITFRTMPFGIESVSPTTLGDNGHVTMTITGARFEPGAAVSLVSGSATLQAAKVDVISPCTTKAVFLLTNAVHGSYTLTISNANGTSLSRPDAVTVESATGPSFELEAIGNLNPRLGTAFTADAVVLNRGNVDAQYVLITGQFSGTVNMSLIRPHGTLPIENHAAPVKGLGTYNLHSGTRQVTGDAFIVKNIEPSQTVQFGTRVTGYGPGDAGVLLRAEVLGVETFVDTLRSGAEMARQSALRAASSELPPEIMGCLLDEDEWWVHWLRLYVDASILDLEDIAIVAAPSPAFSTLLSPPVDTVTCVQWAIEEYQECMNNASAKWLKCLTQLNRSCANELIAEQFWCSVIELGRIAGCLAPLPPECPPGSVWLPCAFVISPAGCIEACIQVPFSRDPNDMTGPAGVGESKYLSPKYNAAYTVHFENVAESTAIAREVRVVDKLVEGIDVHSVCLQEIAFGGCHVTVPANQSFYETRLSLGTNLLADVTGFVDVRRREIRWTLRAIDPATGEPPESAQMGLLPPNDATHRGEGYVTYTVQPMAGVRTGTVITNSAVIVFDNNEPIETAPVWNTIDAGAPSSAVASLPAQVRGEFVVTWSGADDAGGSGVAGYDVHVSDDGGAYALWQANTAANAAVYPGEAGHRYAFYSVARDNVGNLEAAPATADAWTEVLSRLEFQPLPNRVISVNARLVVTNVLVGSISPGARFSLLEGPVGAVIDPQEGVVVWTPTCGQGSTNNRFRVLAQDNFDPPGSATNTFQVAVRECVEASLGSVAVRAGDRVCLPLNLLSTVELTNLTFVVAYPGERFEAPAVLDVDTNIVGLRANLLEPGRFEVSLTLPADRALRGPTNVARVCLISMPGQGSSFVPVRVEDVVGRRKDGSEVGNAYGTPGQAVVVGEQPLLEAAGLTNGQPVLWVYSSPGSRTRLETTTSLEPPVVWQPDATLLSPSELKERAVLRTVWDRGLFIRARRE